jgi:hypothetical protein
MKTDLAAVRAELAAEWATTPDNTVEMDAEYAAHEAAGRCGDCEMGTYPYYGVAPHDCFHKIGAPLGGSIVHPRETWPANFREDPDEPGCGVYECPRCSVEP